MSRKQRHNPNKTVRNTPIQEQHTNTSEHREMQQLKSGIVDSRQQLNCGIVGSRHRCNKVDRQTPVRVRFTANNSPLTPKHYPPN